MNNTGRFAALVALVALLLLPALTRAEVSATVDRQSVALGDTLRLTITATDGEDVQEADLRPLLAEFEILQRSSSSNYSLINGRGSRTEQLQLDITPKREGVLRIPPMRVGKGATPEFQIAVSAAPAADTGGQQVIFEAELDSDRVHVQEQVILTLRLLQSINLEDRSVSELTLDDAFVTKLEQKSFQRNMDGRQWLVHEVRYALFPEHSGTLEIPAQTFSARVPSGRRTLFDRGRGRLVRRNSQPLTVEVLPVPPQFQGASWLPARQLSISEHWSTPPEQLRAGESATRTIRIQGEGVQGAQLPPILFKPVEGLKFYPDQPQISDQEVSTGIMGTRVDSAALVPTRAGTLTLPEIRIPWWDSQAQQLRYATLPERTITVAPADPSTISPVAPQADALVTDDGGATLVIDRQSVLPWQLLALFASLGWLGTVLWFWWRDRRAMAEKVVKTGRVSTRGALMELCSACGANDALRARRAVLKWACAVNRGGNFSSLEQVANWFSDAELTQHLAVLESSLYGKGGGAWSGEQLENCARRLNGERDANTAGEDKMELYPGSA